MVVLGLGTNCGNRLEYLQRALRELKAQGIHQTLRILKIAPLYESQALLPEGAPEHWNQPYLNTVALCETKLDPHELLSLLKSIELKLGRQNRGRWAPREIDLDLIDMDSRQIQTPTLQIPHPEALHRPFVFLPWAELTPDWPISPPQSPGSTLRLREYAQRWKSQTSASQQTTQRIPTPLCQLVGILNLTPDSFSDGGLFQSESAALEQIQTHLQNHVRVLELGAESTRPGATPISPEEEWSRLKPLLVQTLRLKEKAQDSSFFPQISVDTRHPSVAKQALEQGVDWINDVSGLRNPRMLEVILNRTRPPTSDHHTPRVVLMHSLSVPPVRSETLAHEEDPLLTLRLWAQEKIQSLKSEGLTPDQIIFDPGLGFGKTPEQCFEILRRAHELHDLGVPLLIGHSRKSFLNVLPSASLSRDRDPETLSASLLLAQRGIEYLRIHNSGLHAKALSTWALTHGITQFHPEGQTPSVQIPFPTSLRKTP
ncbi:MAG: dihydropteroate synthase [Bdellovibrionia bacterium]